MRKNKMKLENTSNVEKQNAVSDQISELAVSPFESGNSMIVLMETEDAYLMQVDLPSVPMPIGEIISKHHELTVMTGQEENTSSANKNAKGRALLPNILSLHTLGGKIKSFYQEGALYILLPKTHAISPTAV
jgi:hypothetical protein